MVKRTRFSDMSCPVARALDIVGEHWTLLVIREAFFGVTRFGQFESRLGIAKNVLTTRLETLVEQGILERRRYEERPPRDEYLLTARGRALLPILHALKEWGEAEAGITTPVMLIDKVTGQEIEPVFVDRRTKKPIDLERVAAAPKPDAEPEVHAWFRCLAAEAAAREAADGPPPSRPASVQARSRSRARARPPRAKRSSAAGRSPRR